MGRGVDGEGMRGEMLMMKGEVLMMGGEEMMRGEMLMMRGEVLMMREEVKNDAWCRQIPLNVTSPILSHHDGRM